MVVHKFKDYAIVKIIFMIVYFIIYLFIRATCDLDDSYDNFIVVVLLLFAMIALFLRILVLISLASTKKYILFEVSFTEFGLREKYESENNLIKYKKSDLKEVKISTGDLVITIDLIFKNGTAEFLVVYLPKYFLRVFGKKEIDKVVTECKLLFGKKIVKTVKVP